MGQITISLSPDLEEQLRYYAERNGYGTLSDLARDAFREKISNQHKLPYWDRVMLLKTLEILAAVNKDGNNDNITSAIEVLQHGYSSEYQSSFAYVNTDEVGPEVTNFVHEVLGCYGQLQESAKKLNDKEIIEKVSFPGFDGNNEVEYLGYASHLYDTNRYRYIDGFGPSTNSHFHTLPVYRRMLNELQKINSGKKPDERLLTKDEIKSVIAARIHPDNRPRTIMEDIKDDSTPKT